MIEIYMNPGMTHKPMKWILLLKEINERFPDAYVRAGYDRLMLIILQQAWNDADTKFFDDLIRAELLETWRYHIRGKVSQVH